MRIYISGKIGEEVISDATREKFARAERMLESTMAISKCGIGIFVMMEQR